MEKGRRIDRYEVRELIGRGTMGAVYRAVDTRLGRVIALKIIDGRDGQGLARGDSEQLMRDVRAASQVDHPNVVQVLDFGLTEGAVPSVYVVSEQLRGETLAGRLRDRGGSLEVGEAVDIGLAACAALSACHDLGIVHGGLTPRKIFLADTDTGMEVKLRDVGLWAARATPADDQRALGAVLGACLTAGMPEGLRAIVDRAVSPAAGDRFESLQAFGQALWQLARPPGKDRWREVYFRPARPAERSRPFDWLGPLDVPAKELGATQLLPAPQDPGGGDQRALPVAVAGGTVLDRPTGDSGSGFDGEAASEISPPAWAPRPAAPRPGPRLIAWVAVAGGGLLAAVVVLAALGGRAERRPPSAGARQVTPVQDEPAPTIQQPRAPQQPGAPQQPLAPHAARTPEPPHSEAKSAAAAKTPDGVAKTGRASKRASSRRRKLPTVDANGIGILE